jgi:hypothetical protein
MKRPIAIAVYVGAAILVIGLAVFAVASQSSPTGMSGVVVKGGSASVRAVDQLGAHGSIVVAQVVAPDDSWLVAYRRGMEGMPGALLGYVHVGPGTSTDVSVPIDPTIRLTPQAIITLNADRGVRGRFEFDMNHFDTSPDKPYYIAGQAVQTTITVAFPENANSFDPGATSTP